MIETWEAIRYEHTLGAGRTRPLVIECLHQAPDDDTPLRHLMVVKAYDLPETSDIGLFSEIIGNLVAREFGVETPKPVLVELDEDFVSITNSVIKGQGLRLRPGIGVGCEYYQGGFTSPAGTSLTPEQLEQAAMMYGYDLIVQNPDRLPTNPNCGFYRQRLIAFDFNLCFSFLMPIVGACEPWELSKLGIGDKHIFYKSIRGQFINWQPLIDAVDNLQTSRIEEASSLLPSSWQKWTDQVCEHLTQVKNHADKLTFELQRSLI